MQSKFVLVGLFAVSIASVACSKGDQAPPPPAPAPAAPAAPSAPTAAAAPTPSATAAAAPAAPHVELEVASLANTMTFDKTKLTVPTGAEVHLVFKNNATQDVLAHNWVLLAKAGTEAKVAADGLAKGPGAGYLAPGPEVLAYTPLTQPGKTSEVTFTAPAPGTYPYICTFPGHYMMMKGVLTVTP
jgi:azurin